MSAQIIATATGPSSTCTPPAGDCLVTVESSDWTTNVSKLQFLSDGTWFDVDEILTPGTALSLTKNRSFMLPGDVTYRLNPSAWSANISAKFSTLG